MSETPPRAWGRLRFGNPELRTVGNTPTGVGKTPRAAALALLAEKHPHGRGEDLSDALKLAYQQETPPRAWGRRVERQVGEHYAGNTPTGVGKTSRRCRCPHSGRKHPHGRGEDPCWRRWSGRCPETPPRAWGRPGRPWRRELPSRNTPTGVGKTIGGRRNRRTWLKHPHGRGEDRPLAMRSMLRKETPPRAWGRPVLLDVVQTALGNTPTGVGKTPCVARSTAHRRKHPHGRGEDRTIPSSTQMRPETPPRAWGRHDGGTVTTLCTGNTPTGVGKTKPLKNKESAPKKHPHGRGEDPVGAPEADT